MKLGYLFSIAIIPIMMLANTTFDQGQKKNENKEKRDKDNRDQNENDNEYRDQKGDQGNKGKKQDHEYRDQKGDQGNRGKKQDNEYGDQKGDRGNKGNKKFDEGNDNKYSWRDEDRWDDGKWSDNRFDSRMKKIKDYKRKNWVNSTYYPGIVWMNGNNYRDAKGPKRYKKVTICHQTKSNYPVTINVSENAVQAHLNHGDYLGACRDYDRSLHSNSYWTTRTDYYNQYTTTTETLSFGEQLLNLAIGKLTGSRTQLTTLRPSLSPQEINRREIAIINLQNDTYALQRSLDNGNNRISTVNIAY